MPRAFVTRGGGVAVLGPGVVALVDDVAADRSAELTPLYEALAAGADRDLVVRWLSHFAGVVLPPFAVAFDEASALRLLIRGDVLVTTVDDAGAHVHHGVEPAIAWHELVVDVPARLLLRLHGGRDESDGTAPTPLASGRAPAAIVDRWTSGLGAVGQAAGGPTTMGGLAATVGVSPPPDGDVAEAEVDSTDSVTAMAVPVGADGAPAGIEKVAGTHGSVAVDRPAVGCLRFDDGTEVPLSTPLLLGRNPVDGSEVAGAPAAAVRLDDPGRLLSRTHLEVRLVGSTVQVVDRGSVNGSTVTRADGTAAALAAHQAVTIEPGDRVERAGFVGFVMADGLDGGGG